MTRKATIIKAGTYAWFERRFQGADVAVFESDTRVSLKPEGKHWFRTVGQVAGFPQGHPTIMVSSADVNVEEALS